ncbi:MAG: C4-type zinc ribbon domain-containing protein [Gemmatimonadota bacterium]
MCDRMMEETYQALLDLQELDEQMTEARDRVEQFAPRLEEIEAPVEAAREEVDTIRKRRDEMKKEARRLERSADDKRAQLKKYQARLERVRSQREEAAARTEIDLIQKALDADEGDAVELMDQIKRTELKLDELEQKLADVEGEAGPLRQELLEGRDEAESQLKVLADQRENKLVRLTPDAARLYERVKGGKTRVTLARLTADGACGHCFSMIPIQEQNEIRRREALHRCEACGVILYADD